MTRTLAEQIDQRYGQQLGLGDEMPGLEALDHILSRRTVRRYREDPVPAGLLRTLLACAQSAPTKSDLQQYSILVVEDSAARREIASWIPRMPWVGTAPAFLVFCGDMRRNQRLCERHGRPHANNNLDTFFNCTVDAALAMGAFIHAAEAAGLGCCCISNLRNHMEPVTRLLALPPGVFPIAGLTLGWPADPGWVSMRLPQEIVVHRDRYNDRHLRAAVEAYDVRRDQREPIPPEKQRNADVYGTSERCTWSDQVSRQLSQPERPDFGAFLRSNGLDLT